MGERYFQLLIPMVKGHVWMNIDPWWHVTYTAAPILPTCFIYVAPTFILNAHYKQLLFYCVNENNKDLCAELS